MCAHYEQCRQILEDIAGSTHPPVSTRYPADSSNAGRSKLPTGRMGRQFNEEKVDDAEDRNPEGRHPDTWG